MARSIRSWVATMLLSCVATAALAQPRPLVLELFTSEGCSSCPPAETYLGKVSTRSDVIALAFHVDYWDELGWRDRFALPQATLRQSIYARNLHRASVYTPQLVMDGHLDALGSDESAVLRQLSVPRASVPVALHVSAPEVLVEVGQQAGAPRSDILMVAYLRHAVSPIGRGENAGRTLDEFNLVRSVRAVGTWQGEARSFRLPVSALPSDATDVAVLVQRAGQGAILGAAAQPLLRR